ncbi:zinc finger protein GAI-ASSOCIATED FACTOR 1 [Spinacia oleracea]|uniref:Zinc finger protein GAI-ASSOCIATED FACTOR 1 n=1 Tax=Spinacia oleracea TaxID=3562 RepID=A0ABM3REH3_SPIOL|nr:zinc finger protein GAI-ASSOCIATED FACTOR 1-like [Spinacia oleracea]
MVALSPKSLLATNRFACEVCGKGFQRDQNLQLHRRGHNLLWKLRQRGPKEAIKKRVFICPEVSCVHHDQHRALGDLTGIKKHFGRKHGEKKWKCERCGKKRDSFVTHRAFCDALAQKSAKVVCLSPFTVTAPTTTSTSSVVLCSPVLSLNHSSGGNLFMCSPVLSSGSMLFLSFG